MQHALQSLLMSAPALSRPFLSRLLSAFAHAQHGASRSAAAPSPAPRTAVAPASSVLVLPLTRREQEVLRLLADGAANQEIAQALMIEVSTVKKHVSNLLTKLGATSRTQAIGLALASA
jgi:LuxR family maltose regulon positive regulatory protein